MRKVTRVRALVTTLDDAARERVDAIARTGVRATHGCICTCKIDDGTRRPMKRKTRVSRGF